MIRLRYKIGVGIGILSGVFLFGRCGRFKPIVPATLPANDREQIIVDPFHHVIQVVTPQGVRKTTLPDRPSTIDILKNGTVKINSPQFGGELRPFLGAGFTLRGGVVLGGVDFVYWKKLDLGLGLAINPSLIQDTSLFLGVSYIVYSNTSVSLGIDNRQTPMVGLHVRI